MRSTKKSSHLNLTGWMILLVFFALLNVSLDIKPENWLNLNISFNQLLKDLSSSLIRVIVATLLSWFMSIVTGAIFHYNPKLFKLIKPLLNFLRNISPFAWLPIAIILFGIGEIPLFIILILTLFIPSLLSIMKTFETIPKSIIEAAQLDGATDSGIFKRVIIPMLSSNFIHVLRITFGLAWSTIIAVEMLGVQSGLGYRILDFRYLFQTAEMLIYLIIIGLIGLILDYCLGKIEQRFTNRYPIIV